MKNVYIAHPLRGAEHYTEDQCRKNTAMVAQICMAISRDYNTTIVPISPVHAFSFFDTLKCDQKQVLEYCHSLLEACDDMWVFGDWAASAGCLSEIGMFARKGLGSISFCDFCEEAGKITKKASFNLTKTTSQYDNSDKDDLVEYVLEEHKRRNAVA